MRFTATSGLTRVGTLYQGARRRWGLLGVLLAATTMGLGGVAPARIAVLLVTVSLLGSWLARTRPVAPAVRFTLPVVLAVGQVSQTRFGGSALASPMKAAVVILLSGICFAVGATIAQRAADPWHWWLLTGPAAVGVLLLPQVPGLAARSADGAAVSVSVAGMSFIPAEFGRVLVVVAAAAVLAETGRLLSLPPVRFHHLPVPDLRALAPLVVAFVVTALLLMSGSDLGPLLVLALTLLVLVWAAGGHWSWSLGGAVGVGLGLLAMGMLVGKVRVRLFALVHPSGLGDAAQQQLARSRWGVAEGGLLGASPDRMGPHLIYLPNADGVVASFAQLVGLVGLLATAGSVSVLMAAVLRQARHAPAFQHLVATGLIVSWALQLLLLSASTVGMFPLVGLSAPPFTTGGSELMAWAGGLGIGLGGAHLAPQGSHRIRTALAVRPRDRKVLAVLAVFATVVFAGVGDLAVLERSRLVSEPGNPRQSLAHPRGRILDRLGRPLAQDVEGRRQYADPAVTPVVGVVTTQFGATGLEASLGERLTCGGRRIPLTSCRTSDVTTTLDLDVQRVVAAALARAGLPGEVLVMRADGAVLAWTASPALDGPHLLGLEPGRRKAYLDAAEYAGERGVLEDRTGTPGSIAKVITVMAARAAGVNPRDGLGVVLRLPDGSAKIRNADHAACPSATMEGALAHSCNTVFADLAQRLGPGPFRTTAEHLGITRAVELAPGVTVRPAVLGVDAPSTDAEVVAGTLGASPSRWSVVHAAMVGAAVADGGIPVRPTLLPRKASADAPVVTQDAVAAARRGMRAAVTQGTATLLAGLGPDVIAKTGTAADGAGRAEPWMVAVTGSGNAAIVVAIHLRLDHGASGGTTAAPIARQVIRAQLREQVAR